MVGFPPWLKMRFWRIINFKHGTAHEKLMLLGGSSEVTELSIPENLHVAHPGPLHFLTSPVLLLGYFKKILTSLLQGNVWETWRVACGEELTPGPPTFCSSFLLERRKGIISVINKYLKGREVKIITLFSKDKTKSNKRKLPRATFQFNIWKSVLFHKKEAGIE